MIWKEAEWHLNIFEYFVKKKKLYTVTSRISFHKNGFRLSKICSIVLFDKRRFIQICSVLSSFNDRCEWYDGWSVVGGLFKWWVPTLDAFFNFSLDIVRSSAHIDDEWCFERIFSDVKETVDERNGAVSSREDLYIALPSVELFDVCVGEIRNDGLFIVLVVGELGY